MHFTKIAEMRTIENLSSCAHEAYNNGIMTFITQLINVLHKFEMKKWTSNNNNSLVRLKTTKSSVEFIAHRAIFALILITHSGVTQVFII